MVIRRKTRQRREDYHESVIDQLTSGVAFFTDEAPAYFLDGDPFRPILPSLAEAWRELRAELIAEHPGEKLWGMRFDGAQTT